MTHSPNVTNPEEAKAAGWRILAGDPSIWETVAKAVYQDDEERVVHGTKRMPVPGGWLYEVYTTRYGRVRTAAGRIVDLVDAYSHSKAVVFVPYHRMVEEDPHEALRVREIDAAAGPQP